MNVLPLVFAFMLIFSFLTLGFIRERMFSCISEKSIHSFHKTSRAVLNSIAKKHYKRIKTTGSPAISPKTSLSSTPLIKSRGKYSSRRMTLPPSTYNKFNLSPLLQLQTDPKTHPLYQVYVRFLRILYEECLFKECQEPHLEYQLLIAMIKKYQNTKEVNALSDLYPENPELKHIFYKMLKGTNQYDVKEMRGIPPFEDFFYLTNKETSSTGNPPVIFFSSASPLLLEALVEEKNTLKILEEEQKKWESSGSHAGLSQNELTSLLSHDRKSSALVIELGSYLNFSPVKMKRNYISGIDKTSGLIIKKKC